MASGKIIKEDGMYESVGTYTTWFEPATGVTVTSSDELLQVGKNLYIIYLALQTSFDIPVTSEVTIGYVKAARFPNGITACIYAYCQDTDGSLVLIRIIFLADRSVKAKSIGKTVRKATIWGYASKRG